MKVIVSALVAIILLVVVLLVLAGRRPKPVLRPETQTQIDSLRLTQPSFDSTRADTKRLEDSAAAEGYVLRNAVTKMQITAAVLKTQADKLAEAAHAARVNARAWQDAYEKRTEEADALRTALAKSRLETDAERRARRQADLRAALDSERLVAVNRLNASLQRDLAGAEHCRFLWLVPCATRAQMMLVGIGVGVAADETARVALRALTAGKH